MSINPEPFIDHPLKAQGRFGRLSYLAWNALSSIILYLFLIIPIVSFGYYSQPQDLQALSTPLIFILIIFTLAFFYLYITFMIRRLHDVNQTGWFALLIFIPLVNLILALYLLFAPGTQGENNYGPQRITKGWEKVLAWIYIILVIVSILSSIILVMNTQ